MKCGQKPRLNYFQTAVDAMRQLPGKQEAQPEGLRPGGRSGPGSKIAEQERLRLARDVGEQHGNLIALGVISTAGDDHSLAVHFSGVAGPLQTDGHFRPGRDRTVAAKLDPIFADLNRVSRESKALGRGEGAADRQCGISFSSTHIVQ